MDSVLPRLIHGVAMATVLLKDGEVAQSAPHTPTGCPIEVESDRGPTGRWLQQDTIEASASGHSCAQPPTTCFGECMKQPSLDPSLSTLVYIAVPLASPPSPPRLPPTAHALPSSNIPCPSRPFTCTPSIAPADRPHCLLPAPMPSDHSPMPPPPLHARIPTSRVTAVWGTPCSS